MIQKIKNKKVPIIITTPLIYGLGIMAGNGHLYTIFATLITLFLFLIISE